MKIMPLMLSVLFTISTTAKHAMADDMHFSIITMNQFGDFVSENLAKKIALAILDEKYPKGVFAPREDFFVSDLGDFWSITFTNLLINESNNEFIATISGVPVPRKLTFTIRKSNCELISIN